jgi:hypothetical protein
MLVLCIVLYLCICVAYIFEFMLLEPARNCTNTAVNLIMPMALKCAPDQEVLCILSENIRSTNIQGVKNIPSYISTYIYVYYFESHTVRYRICRDRPTNALSCILLYLHDGCYMFRQDNAILRERLGSF